MMRMCGVFMPASYRTTASARKSRYRVPVITRGAGGAVQSSNSRARTPSVGFSVRVVIRWLEWGPRVRGVPLNLRRNPCRLCRGGVARSDRVYRCCVDLILRHCQVVTASGSSRNPAMC